MFEDAYEPDRPRAAGRGSTSGVRYVGAVNLITPPEGSRTQRHPASAAAAVPAVPSPSRRLTSPVPPPSSLLQALVEHVCYYRNVPVPPVIYPEVVVAFDEFISKGTMLKKFIQSGPPHHRFFCIRFLDLNLPRPDLGPRAIHVPEPVLGYCVSSKSRNMRRFFPLADLVKVSSLSDEPTYSKEEFNQLLHSPALPSTPQPHPYSVYQHPNIRKRMVEPGVIKVERKGVVQKYIKTDCIFVMHFVSHVSPAEEHIACFTTNSTVFLAWLVVLRFFADL